jgi:hypothetical protein
MMTERLRLTLICAAAAIVGIAVGFASSNGWSYVRDRPLSVSAFFRTEAIGSMPSEGLAIACEFVDSGKTAAFENAVFEAEQSVRQRLAPQSPSMRWLVYRSHEHADDGSVLYVLWFEQHGDLETSVLSDVLRLQIATQRPRRCWPDRAALTLVPVLSTTVSVR